MIADYLVERYVKLTLDGESYPKLRLGNFFRLRKIEKVFFDSLRGLDKDAFKKSLTEILELQTKKRITDDCNLYKAIISAIEIFKFNEFENPPAALVPPPKPKNSKVKDPRKQDKNGRWEYPGEYMAEWIDYFARTYGWSLNAILNLDIDVAGYLLQEIFLDQQLKKEWEYNLSELAYPYDSQTKKSTHKPLQRPYWMNDAVDMEIKKTKLIRAMLPMGEIIDLSGIGVISSNETMEKQDENRD